MRTDTHVQQQEVVALVLEDVASAVSAQCDQIRKCITKEEVGWTRNISKDFLRPNSSSLKISRPLNTAHKKKCVIIILKALPSEMCAELKYSKITTVLASCLHIFSLFPVTCQETVRHRPASM